MPTDCLFVSIDVSSLYTKIPHQEGKQAVMDYLSTNTSDPVQPEPEVIGKQYATASHHLTLLQTNLNSGTVPKGLISNIKVTAFTQNTAVDNAVQKCLKETSTKLVHILIAHSIILNVKIAKTGRRFPRTKRTRTNIVFILILKELPVLWSVINDVISLLPARMHRKSDTDGNQLCNL